MGSDGVNDVLGRLDHLGQTLVECRGQEGRDATDSGSSVLFLHLPFILQQTLLLQVKLMLLILMLLLLLYFRV